MPQQSQREITPLTEGDCFLVFDRRKKVFDFPVHFHPEYELNFILNAEGARRIAGDHISEIEDYELVLVGPNLLHGWEQADCRSPEIHEITIQFHKDLLSNSLLDRNIMYPIKELLEKSSHGISFSKDTSLAMAQRIQNLAMKKGFDSLLELLSLLYDLSVSRNQRLLSTAIIRFDDFYNSEKIRKVYFYINQHYHEKIKLKDISDDVNMTIISFNRMIKQRTGKTFVQFLNDFRISYATRMLIESNKSITEISSDCGFNNQANFNRTFKKSKACSPSEYKSRFAGVRKIN